MSRATEHIAQIPWIKRLKKPMRCDSYVRAPLSLYFDNKSKRATKHETLEEYRCKRPAYWKFTGAKRNWQPTGHHCWSHLMSILFSMEEEERYKKWLKRQEEKDASQA